MTAGKRACLIPLLLLAVCGGCSPNGPSGEGSRTAVGDISSPGQRSPAPVPAPPSAYTVTFSPAAPTAADAVRAVLRDAASHREVPADSWIWIVNGTGRKESSDTLAAGSVGKGDEIEARTTVAGPGGTTYATSRKVRIANAPPRVTRAALSNQSPRKGDTISVDAAAEDIDGEAVRLTYRWMAGGKVLQEGDRAELVLADAKRDDEVHCEVVPSDGESTGISLATPVVAILNSPPAIRSMPPAAAGMTGTYIYRVVAEDPDGDVPVVELVDGPEGASFEGGTFRWDPPPGFRGTVRVLLRATDAAGGETRQEFTLRIGEMQG